MKKAWILVGMACGLAGALVGCDGASASSAASSQGSSVAGRVAFDSAGVKATDANGDTVASGAVGHGVFTLRLPEGVHYPLLLVVDSAGYKLRTLMIAPDSGKVGIEINRLTDSACKHLGGAKLPPLVGPKEWLRQLDSLRPVTDTLALRPPRDSGYIPVDVIPRHPSDSGMVGPRPPFGDTGKIVVRPPVKDSGKIVLPPPFKDSGKIVVRPPVKDSGKTVVRPPVKDSGKIVLPPPVKDSGKIVVRPPVKDTGKIVVRPPLVPIDSLKLPVVPRDTVKWHPMPMDSVKIVIKP